LEVVVMEKSLCPKCGHAIELDFVTTVTCPKCQMVMRSTITDASVLTRTEPDSSESEPGDFVAQWRVECEEAAFALAELIALSGRQRSPSAAIELLRSIPKSMKKTDSIDPNSTLYRYLMAARDHTSSSRMVAVINGVERITSMTARDRELLDACLVGAFVGWASGG
jgi:hypothetical protein